MLIEQWDRISGRLLKTIGQNNHTTWIAPLRAGPVDQQIATLFVPTTFSGNYISQNFSDLILHEIKSAGVDVSRLNFVLASSDKDTAQPPATPRRAVARKTRSTDVMSNSSLDKRFSFDTFVVGKPNELAHAAARRVAEGGPVTFNPLFLYGGVGLGKTHLMHAIAQELRERRPDMNVLYLSAEQFMYRFVQALRDRKMMDFKEIFRSVDVLMVDDVQFIAGKDSTQEEFFHTFNALVDQNKQIIISADRAPGDIKDLEERVKTRLQCGLVVDLHPTDYELRLGILQSKVEAQRVIYPGLDVAEGVLEFMAHRITTNVRVLEGALTRLFAFASLVGREINMDLTQDCLADVLPASGGDVPVQADDQPVPTRNRSAVRWARSHDGDAWRATD